LVAPVAAAAVAAAATRADEEAAARAASARDAAVAQALARPGEPADLREPAAVPAAAPVEAPAPPPPVEQPAVEQPRDTLVGRTVGVEETGGIGGLFAGSPPAEAEPDEAAVAPPVAPPPPAPPAAGVPLVGPRRRPASSRRTLLLVAAALLLVVVLGVGGALLLGGDDDPSASSQAGTSAASASTAPALEETGPQPGDSEVVDGRTFVVQGVQVDPTCAGNAYGEVADFFAQGDCTGLARALYSTDVAGRPVVVSVSTVAMPDTAGARELRALTDRNGSGNVSDLLREGVRYAGSPQALSGAEYASAVSGSTVTIVETAWAGPGSGGSAADLDVVASAGLVLPMPEPTA
ncbi:hypothetical protein PGN05_09855, partial [Geodermatophilus sp. CPCC 206100]